MSVTNESVILPGGQKLEDVPKVKVGSSFRVELEPGESAVTILGPWSARERLRGARMFARVAWQLLVRGRVQFTITRAPDSDR